MSGGRGEDPAVVGEQAIGGERRADVQGLRALAVGLVVLDHAGVSWVRGGYVGVDVFFVLSGFLITGLLVREAARDGRVGLGSFYARRARRILPAATVVLVAAIAFVALELSYRATQRVTTDAGWAAAFLANVHFSAVGTDYFAQGSPPSPLQHYWSLAVEEQFYLVWPPLLLLLLLLCRRRTWPTWRVVGAVATVLVACSFGWSVLSTHHDATAAYFSSAARAWELGVGVLLALGWRRLRGLPRGVREALAVAGLVSVVVAAWTYDATTPFPGSAALLPVAGTAAMVAAGPAPTLLGRVLSWRPMTWVGDLSYSIYLWHWPVLVLWTERTGPHRTRLETVALLAVTLALSVASYHLVENPVRRGRWWRGARLRGLVLWPVALAVVAVAVVGGRQLAGERLHDRIQASHRYAGLRAEHLTVREELAQSLRMADHGAPIAFPLDDLSEVDTLRQDLWNNTYTCWVGHDRSEARICPVGDVSSGRTVVVIGDSHAGQWLPAIDALGHQRGYRVVPLIKYGCTVYDIRQMTELRTRPYTECDDFRTWVLGELPKLHPDIVYVGSRSLPPNMVGGDRLTTWTGGVRRFLQELRRVTPDVRVLGDTTRLSFDPVDCLTDVRATMATCTGWVRPAVRETNAVTRRIADEVGARYLDVLPLTCLHDRCPAFAGGRMVYANDDHLSVDWVRHVLPAFARLDPA